jgi:hypothetical protein
VNKTEEEKKKEKTNQHWNNNEPASNGEMGGKRNPGSGAVQKGFGSRNAGMEQNPYQVGCQRTVIRKRWIRLVCSHALSRIPGKDAVSLYQVQLGLLTHLIPALIQASGMPG